MIPRNPPGTLVDGEKRVASRTLSGFISENTKKAYGRDYMDFFCVSDVKDIDLGRVLAVTPEDVGMFRDRLLAKGTKDSTVCRKMASLHSLYENLKARGLVKINPADSKLVRRPKSPAVRHTPFLEAHEVRSMIDAPDRSTPLGIRDYVMIRLAIHSGLRRAEICSLKDRNLDKRNGLWCVVVKGKGGKERMVPVRDDVVEAVEEWKRVRPAGAEWLFSTMEGRRVTENQFWKRLRTHARSAGLAEGRVRPHVLRATFIRFQHDAGTKIGFIQQLAGHSKADTTLGYIRELDLLSSGAERALDGVDAPGRTPRAGEAQQRAMRDPQRGSGKGGPNGAR